MELNINQEYIFMIRIVLAAVCGGVIGIERQLRTKSAGTRTHVMIAIAACLIMIISKYGFSDITYSDGVRWDVSRVAAGIVTSLGFLGGGLFFTGKQGYVSGITTAAGLLVTLGVGMAVGAGMYVLSLFTTIFVAIIQLLFHKNLWVVKQAIRVGVIFKVQDRQKGILEIESKLNEYGVSLNQFKYEKKDDYFLLTCHVIMPSKYSKEEIINILTSIDEMVTFEIS